MPTSRISTKQPSYPPIIMSLYRPMNKNQEIVQIYKYQNPEKKDKVNPGIPDQLLEL